MRLYLYINKELIQSLAAKISNFSFDIDFFEYTERRGYSVNNSTCIRPEMDNKNKVENKMCLSRIGASGETGSLSKIEIEKRFINIEDVSSIKNNKFYYNIVENIQEDNRINIVPGIIRDLNDKYFRIENNKYIIDSKVRKCLLDEFENEAQIICVGYKISDLNSNMKVYKVIAIYIE